MVHLGEPLLPNVFKGGGRGHREADQEDVGLWIRERAQAIVILLTGGIKQSQGVRLIADPEFGERSVRSVSLRLD